MFNVQRAITPKVGKPKLQFMCSAWHLMVFYICVRFRENITNGIRVMVHVFCLSSDGALHLCEVS